MYVGMNKKSKEQNYGDGNKEVEGFRSSVKSRRNTTEKTIIFAVY